MSRNSISRNPPPLAYMIMRVVREIGRPGEREREKERERGEID